MSDPFFDTNILIDWLYDLTPAGALLVTRNTKDFPATMPGIRVPYTL